MAVTDQTLAGSRDLRAQVGGAADEATRALAGRWVDGWDRLAPMWVAALTPIAAGAVAAGGWPGPWELTRDPGVIAATMATRTALDGLVAQAQTTTVGAAGDAVTATVAAEPVIMASQLPAGQQHDAQRVFAAAVGAAVVAGMVADLAPRIAPLSSPITTVTVAAISRALTRGAHPGTDSGSALTARVRDEVQRAFNSALTSVVATLRTQVLDAYRAAARTVQDANGRYIAGWVWISSLDGRTCPSCWAMHGRFFPTSVAGPYDHRQGRCVRLPRLRRWSELGFAGREPADRIPDAHARFSALPADEQRRILGPGRWSLLHSGAVGWDDLPTLRHTPGARPAYQPRTVAELQSIARARANNAA